MRAAFLTLLLAGCASVPASTPQAAAPVIAATAETDPVDSVADAADDPAIWRNAADPAASLVIGTDKKVGIHVYDLKGKRLSFTPAARLNNVDLRTLADGRVIAAASDRRMWRTRMSRCSPSTPLRAGWCRWAAIRWGRARPMACACGPAPATGAVRLHVVLKDGRIDQVRIDLSARLRAWTVRSMKLDTQAEGCVVDDRTGQLYVAEEDVGLWRFAADPAAPTTATPIARVDGRTLVADAEGLALAPKGATGGYLVVSSQGDSAYTVYRLPDMAYAGRFRIGGGAIDGTSETDGIELVLGDFGPDYPQGLFVAQDGDNAPDTQNFKYVSWAKVVEALGL